MVWITSCKDDDDVAVAGYLCYHLPNHGMLYDCLQPFLSVTQVQFYNPNQRCK